MTTLKAGIERLLDELPDTIGFYGTADSTSTTGIVWVLRFQNSGSPSRKYQNWWAWRSDATGNDTIKPLTTLATATITIGSTNYSDTGNNKYVRLLRPDWHPDYVLSLANRALELCWQYWRAPLTIVPDGDGENTTVYTSDDSNATTTRITTAASVMSGQSAYQVANSGANGYHQYASFDAANGRAFKAGGFVRITTAGEAFIQVIDVTNSNTVLASETVSGVGQFHYVQFTGSFPANCYKAAIRVGADDASAVTVWDDVFLYWEPLTQVYGPSWLNETKTDDGDETLRLYRYQNLLVGDGAGPARAFMYEAVPAEHYSVTNIPDAANPIAFELSQRVMAYPSPVMIEARRTYASFGELDGDTDTTGCPEKLWVAAMKYLAAKDGKLDGNVKELHDTYLSEQRKAQGIILQPPPDNGGQAWRRL